MVIDDDIGQLGFRQGIVAGARLRIDHANEIELLKINIAQLMQFETQVADQGPVLAAPDSPVVGNRALNAGRAVGKSTKGDRRGDGVRIGVILHHDE